MFTGIITDMGEVIDITNDGDTRFRIQTSFDMAGVDIGASIAHSGVCLTVVEKGADWYDVVASTETLNKTNLSEWTIGTRVNLERSLKMGDELGGHFVFGHVDCVTRVKAIKAVNDCHEIHIELPTEFAGFVVPKGSIALNGISLTVNDVRDGYFTLMIIPHTWDVTNFQFLKVGDTINFETDMLARYVAKQMALAS